MARLTEDQFKKLIELTSIRPDSATHAALYQHLVLGYSPKEAQEAAGVGQSTLSAALKRMAEADARARAYCRTSNASPFQTSGSAS